MSYTFSATGIKPASLQKVLDDNSIVNDGVNYSDGEFTVLGTFTPTQEDEIDALIPATQLYCAKASKNQEIKAKTDELIALGFTYSGDQYDLSDSSRADYVGMQVLSAYPYYVTNLDNSDTLTIHGVSTLEAFISDALARYTYIVYGASDLVDDIRDATTVEAVQAIVDTRV